MSEKHAHNEVSIRCRVRLASIANIHYGESSEMTCVMLEGECSQCSTKYSLDEKYCATSSKNECVDERKKGPSIIELNELKTTEENDGPKLLFKPVPRPPLRLQTQMLSSNETKTHFHVDQAASLPVYNRISGNTHMNSQPTDLSNVQNSSRIRKSQYSSIASARAAAMFAVKKGTVEDLLDKDETYAILMKDVASVNLKPSLVDRNKTDTDLIDIATKHKGLLQISFYHLHEQDLLFGFLQAFLEPSLIKLQPDITMKSIPYIYRSESSKTMDMERFEARAVTGRFLNESFWDKIKRRTSRLLSRTEEICLCADDEEKDLHSYSNCAAKCNQTLLTELEIDDDLSLNRDLTDIEENTSYEVVWATNNSQKGCMHIQNGADPTSTIVDADDDRDDMIRTDRKI